jgi:hypothetical protein
MRIVSEEPSNEYSPELTLAEYKEWKKRGFSRLQSRKWARAGFTPEEAEGWFSYGFTVGGSLKFREEGFTPAEAKRKVLSELRESIGSKPAESPILIELNDGTYTRDDILNLITIRKFLDFV